jgi:tetratricopeptide (TPR) repeat protein
MMKCNGRAAQTTRWILAIAAGALLCVICRGQTAAPDSVGTKASGASITGKQDGAAVALAALNFGDVGSLPPSPGPPAPVFSQPIPAPAVSSALAPLVAKLPVADAESLHAIGETIARQLNQTQDESQRRFLVEAGTQVLKEIERRNPPQAPSDQPEPSFRKPDIEKTAYRQAVSIANKMGGLVSADNAGAPLEPIREISRSAWEGAGRTETVPVYSGGTRFFSFGVARPETGPGAVGPADGRAASAPPDNAPAAPKVNVRGPDLTYVPPPPQSRPGTEKGVRIAFDPATLRLAEKRLPSLDVLEDQLRAARTPEDVSQTLTWLDHRVNTALAGEGNVAELERPVVVSLRSLVTAAIPFGEHWETLPDNLRHPGQLRRLHGLLIDAEKNDVLLVGSTEGQGEPLTIDELIVGFRSAWCDASTPLCSLEPDPQNMGGPQTAVIAGVDRETQFARVMLDADYTMKRLVFGQLKIDSPGFVDLHSAYAAYFASQGKENAALANHWTARFWFMPAPPAEGAIRLSADGSLAMFDCRVQVLTENLAQRGNSFANTGSRNPVVERITTNFSEHFDLFEGRFPVIRELHALCDIALAAQLARKMNAPHDLLTALVRLPVRRVEVPLTYAGLNLPIEIADVKVGAIQGGVNMVEAVTPACLARVADVESERFAAEALAKSGIERHAASANPHFIRSPLASSLTGDTPLARATGMIAGGSYNAALALLDAELAADPENVPARRLRVRALAGRGLFHLAERELEIIETLEDAPDAEDLRLKLHLDRGDPILLESIPTDRQARLLSLYSNEAISQAAATNFAGAILTASRALVLAPRDGELLARRAQWELASGKSDAAMADFQRAIDLSPRSGKPLLARAQAYERLGRLEEALRDANHALELDPSLAEAYCVRIEVALLSHDGDLKAAYEDTRKVQALTPDDPLIYVYRAQILLHEGDRDGAMAAANRAVKLGPGIAQAYSVRGRILALQVRGLADSAILSEQVENEDRFVRTLSDYNAAIGLRPNDWEAHQMRAAALLDLAANVGEPAAANLDWQKLTTVALGAVSDSQRAADVLARTVGAMAPDKLDPRVVAAALKLGFLYAADDDLNDSLAHTPADSKQEIVMLSGQIHEKIRLITGEPLP